MSNNYPSERTLNIFYAVMPQIQGLLFQWAGKLNDRTSALSRDIVENVNVVLAQARTVLTRDVSVVYVRPVAVDRPVTPGALFVALLQAHVALVHFAESHDIQPVDENDDRD